MRRTHRLLACLALLLPLAAAADTLKVLTAGAFKQVVLAAQPAFEQRTGHRLDVQNDTAGALARRIEAGEAFDVLFLPPEAIRPLEEKGRTAAGCARPIARVGIGVAVKRGAALPPMATVEDFQAAVRAASRVAYIDPAAGGSSGIYLDGLFRQMGLEPVVKPKAVLVQGGLVAEKLVSGEADLAIHQISEILPVAGAQLVAPLPESIQRYTTYGGTVSASTPHRAAGLALLAALSGADVRELLASKGMAAVPGDASSCP
jgi:molybdate transport system substrate-binding protein